VEASRAFIKQPWALQQGVAPTVNVASPWVAPGSVSVKLEIQASLHRAQRKLVDCVRSHRLSNGWREDSELVRSFLQRTKANPETRDDDFWGRIQDKLQARSPLASAMPATLVPIGDETMPDFKKILADFDQRLDDARRNVSVALDGTGEPLRIAESVALATKDMADIARRLAGWLDGEIDRLLGELDAAVTRLGSTGGDLLEGAVTAVAAPEGQATNVFPYPGHLVAADQVELASKAWPMHDPGVARKS
jgi:hypothetical protein